MPDNSTVWTFTQLGGAKKKLTLSDHAAPHGGPRRSPVVTDEIEAREDEVYYDGGPDVPPTRHIFGLRYVPLQLNGRFSDRRGGKNFAREKTAEVKQFVADLQPVAVVWDDIVACTGFIKSFKPERESGGEVAWDMTILVDGDDLLTFEASPSQPPPSPSSFANRIMLALANLEEITRVPPTLRGDVFDLLDSMVSTVNSATAYVASVAAQIDSFANAPFALSRRLRFGLEQLGTAVANLRQTYDDLKTNSALEYDGWNESLEFLDLQARWNTSFTEALRQASLAMDASAQADFGRTRDFYEARGGDTWERIAVQYYGDTKRAEDIRNANGVDVGVQPVPGTTYRIPK